MLHKFNAKRTLFVESMQNRIRATQRRLGFQEAMATANVPTEVLKVTDLVA